MHWWGNKAGDITASALLHLHCRGWQICFLVPMLQMLHLKAKQEFLLLCQMFISWVVFPLHANDIDKAQFALPVIAQQLHNARKEFDLGSSQRSNRKRGEDRGSSWLWWCAEVETKTVGIKALAAVPAKATFTCEHKREIKLMLAVAITTKAALKYLKMKTVLIWSTYHLNHLNRGTYGNKAKKRTSFSVTIERNC